MKTLNLKKEVLRRRSRQAGLAPIALAVIVALILVVGGAVYFFVAKKPLGGGGAKGIEKSLEELKVEAIELDFSLSPLPKLNVSSLNISSPSLPGGDIFSGFSVDTNFSYQGNLDISAPGVQLNIPTQPTQAPQVPSQSQQGAVNAANCAQFSAIPSAQYCSMVGNSSGVTLCQQCKAAGF